MILSRNMWPKKLHLLPVTQLLFLKWTPCYSFVPGSVGIRSMMKSKISSRADNTYLLNPKQRQKNENSPNNLPLLPQSSSSSSGITTSSSLYAVSGIPTEDLLSSTTSTGIDSTALLTYLLQAVISNGVPALFTIVVIGFAAFQFRPRRDKTDSMNMFSTSSKDDFTNSNPIALLYNDMYGEQDQDPLKKRKGFFSAFNPMKSPLQQIEKLAKNTGIPLQQYIKVTNLNQKYSSYQFSVQAATQSKAFAANQYRQTAFMRAMNKSNISLSTYSELQKLEQKYLQIAIDLLDQINSLQVQLTKMAIEDELQTNLGMDKKGVFDILNKVDPFLPTNATGNITSVLATTAGIKTTGTVKGTVLTSLAKAQKELQETELKFIQEIVRVTGPENAASIQAAFLGNNGSPLLSAVSSPTLLSDGTVRPLQRIFGNNGSEVKRKKKVYVMNFPGDVSASQVSNLREVITSIVLAQKASSSGMSHDYSTDERDEAVVILQSGGGTVTGYGLAAAQLMRLKDQANLKLTICVEQVAASGGYMMACIGDKIVASPFAVLGSIGVISDIPNVYDRLKKEGIEFQTITAGKYKRTITPTKKITKEDVEKSKEDIEEIFMLFRDFVKQNRPKLKIEEVATGETWFGTAALERNLCDEIKTVDDVLTEHVMSGCDVFLVEYQPPIEQSAIGKLLNPSGSMSSTSMVSSESDGSILEQPIRWFVRTLAKTVREELSSVKTDVSIEKRYMAMDDTADRIRSD